MSARVSASRDGIALPLHDKLRNQDRTSLAKPALSAHLLQRRSSRSIERLLRALGEFTLVLEGGWVRHFWNHDRRLTLLHRHVAEVVDDAALRWIENACDEACLTRHPLHTTHFVRSADGSHEVALTVMCVSSGASSGRVAYLIARDLTKLRMGSTVLQKSEALLAQAEELANVGSWEVEAGSNTLSWSAHFFKMLGLPVRANPLPHGYGLGLIHSEDRSRAERDAEHARATGEPFENELRFVTPHRGVRIFHSRAVPVRDASGRIVRIRGMSQDVTEQREAEQKLHAREALLAQAEEIASLGSYEFDYATNSLAFSPNLHKIYRFAAGAQWNVDEFWSLVHADDRPKARKLVEDGYHKKVAIEYLIRLRRRDGAMRHLHVQDAPLTDAKGNITRRVGVVQDVTDRVRQDNELRRLSQDLLRARDEEQRRIARELHESAGQTLAALKMSLGRLRDTLPEGDTVERALLRSAAELADEAVREVRTISYVMHPPMLDEAGLVPALGWFVRGFGDRSGIRVSLNIPEALPRSPREIETTVFRIVQEALTNVHRYSGSRTAEVHVLRNNGNLVAEIRDHGCGLPPPTRVAGAPTDRGVGIAGMRERVKQLDGLFELESTAGKGTVVRAILPVSTEPAAHNHRVIHAHLVSSIVQEETKWAEKPQP